MRGVRGDVLGGAGTAGKNVGHRPEEIAREVAYIAYHFHWPKREIMEMTARERRGWIASIAGLNMEIDRTAKTSFAERMAALDARRGSEGGEYGT